MSDDGTMMLLRKAKLQKKKKEKISENKEKKNRKSILNEPPKICVLEILTFFSIYFPSYIPIYPFLPLIS